MIHINEISKRLLGFEKFWEEKKPMLLASEIQLFHEKFPFCGTADLICWIPKGKKGNIWLIDYKTGNPYKTHEIQLSCYAMIWNEIFESHKIDKVGCLYLKDSWRKAPTYTLKEYKIDFDLVRVTYELWKWHNTGARDKAPEPFFKPTFPSKFDLNKEEEENNNKEKENGRKKTDTKVQG